MTERGRTRRSYEEAVAVLRATHPTAGAAVLAYVGDLETHLRSYDSRLVELEARVRELIEIKTSVEGPEDLIVVDQGGQAIASTSGREIYEAALALTSQLVNEADRSPVDITTEASILYGPVSGPVFSMALTILFTEFREVLTLGRSMQ